MVFTFERAADEIKEKLPQDRGAAWLVSRFGFVVGKDEYLQKSFGAGDPDAARVHRLLFEQFAHLRDCPVYPGQKPYSNESRQAALDLAEEFASATELPVDVVQANWATVADDIYPGEQEIINTPRIKVFTE